MKKEAFHRILPFTIFMAFIGLEEGLRLLIDKGVIGLSVRSLHFIYPVKTLSVALVLVLLLPRYHEISLRDLARYSRTTLSILTGLAVFVMWINMDWPIGTLGNPTGFNPHLFTNDFTRTFLSITRISGAVVVVPVMEELFWRSFLVRYLIDQDFSKVPLGRFTWKSFLVSTALFGLEHDLFLAGMMAGAAYNMLLCHTRSLAQCIVAHAVTNLALGIFVLQTGKWNFW